jgi:hypothetical protein
MIKKATLLLSIACGAVNAQTITQTFGSGGNAFSIDFVEIGNPGNTPDTAGSPNPAGSVSYVYNLGKYEISRDMIDKANNEGGLGITMYDMSGYGGNIINHPATGISWNEAARFVNYLNISSGYMAAYKISGNGSFQLWSAGDSGYNASNQFRNSLAKYVLPSSSEWYKGAYGSPNGYWYKYPTGSDSRPIGVQSGTAPDTAVYNITDLGLGVWPQGPSDINDAGGLSAYGTMAQGGNVWEFTETAFDGINDTPSENREFRGGSWYYMGWGGLESSELMYGDPAGESNYNAGFRVAMVPEPSALSLLAIGLGGLAMMRRRRS